MRPALLVALTTVLVLAGCGATKPARITPAATILSMGGFWTHAKVSCTKHTCNMAWRDRVFDAHSAWLGARVEVWNVDDDARLKSIRRFNLRIVDPHSGRVATFACVLHHYGLRPFPKGVSSVSYPDARKSCVERLRTLT